MKTTGYAAITPDGSIIVDTVSSSDRAAMVNWLVVHARFHVPVGMGDFAIREEFDRRGKARGVTVKPVSIAIALHGEAA